jgi:hypothetical protein
MIAIGFVMLGVRPEELAMTPTVPGLSIVAIAAIIASPGYLAYRGMRVIAKAQRRRRNKRFVARVNAKYPRTPVGPTRSPTRVGPTGSIPGGARRPRPSNPASTIRLAAQGSVEGMVRAVAALPTPPPSGRASVS